MANYYIDTHAHLYGEEFDADINEVVERAKQAGALAILLPPTDYASSLKCIQLSKRHKNFFFPMLGLHPEDVRADYSSQLNSLYQLLHSVPSKSFVAIGEVGLDFHWQDSKTTVAEQKDAFCRQIEWALESDLPLMIHARDAHQELLQCLLPYKDNDKLRGVFHCFAGSVSEAKDLISLFPSFCLGIGGVLTFKKSTLPEVLIEASVPLGSLVLETDSPYLAPVPMRGKRNESSFIPYVIRKLAEVYGVTPEEVAQTTTQTASRLFGLGIN